MSSSSVSAHPTIGPELHWSDAEKAIARRAFDAALNRELRDAVRQAKMRASKVAAASELWELERYLTERRKRTDRKYDYRYSVLPFVLGDLIREGWLKEKELLGLGDEKLEYIRSYVRLWSPATGRPAKERVRVRAHSAA